MRYSISLNFKYLSMTMNCEKWNFEPIGNFVHSTELLALKALLARCNFLLVAHYSFKFTRYSLLVTKLARCKKSFTS